MSRDAPSTSRSCGQVARHTASTSVRRVTGARTGGELARERGALGVAVTIAEPDRSSSSSSRREACDPAARPTRGRRRSTRSVDRDARRRSGWHGGRGCSPRPPRRARRSSRRRARWMSAGTSRLSVGCPNTITRSTRSPKLGRVRAARGRRRRGSGRSARRSTTSASSGAPSSRATSSARSPAPLRRRRRCRAAAASCDRVGSTEPADGVHSPGLDLRTVGRRRRQRLAEREVEVHGARGCRRARVARERVRGIRLAGLAGRAGRRPTMRCHAAPKMPGCSVVWLEPMPRSSSGRSPLSTMSGTPEWCASSTAGCRLATAVPEVVTTTTGSPVSTARPRARNPADRSSMRTCRRRSPAARTRRPRGRAPASASRGQTPRRGSRAHEAGEQRGGEDARGGVGRGRTHGSSGFGGRRRGRRRARSCCSRPRMRFSCSFVAARGWRRKAGSSSGATARRAPRRLRRSRPLGEPEHRTRRPARPR